MSDTITTNRVEPTVGPHAAPPPTPPVPAAVPVGETYRPASPVVATGTIGPASAELSSPYDQLARLEDKTARIEEKLSRSESSTQRVVDRFEASSHRMSEVAQQSDLQAVRGEVKFIARRVKNLPGFAALILSSVITAALAAVLVIVIIRYMPGLLAR